MIYVSRYPDTHNIVRNAAVKVAADCDRPFIKKLLLKVAEDHDTKHQARNFLKFAEERKIKVRNIAYDDCPNALALARAGAESSTGGTDFQSGNQH